MRGDRRLEEVGGDRGLGEAIGCSWPGVREGERRSRARRGGRQMGAWGGS